jgi:hypothetical protein
MRTPPPQREKACGGQHVLGETLQMEQFDFTKNEEKLGVQFIREVSLSYRIPSGKKKAKTFISGPDRAADFIRRVLPDNVREHFMALYLDGSHSVVAYSVVATGGARYCPVIPREVFQPAVLVGALLHSESGTHNYLKRLQRPYQFNRLCPFCMIYQ